MPDISPLASQIINKTPELVGKLSKYRDQNREAELACDGLEAEISRVKERIDAQKQLREDMKRPQASDEAVSRTTKAGGNN